MQIKDTIVIVTGGASGLGANTAQTLSKLGAKVAIFDQNTAAVQATAQQINCLGCTCDVTNEESVQHAIQQVAAQYGVARVCINFAGILGSGKILSHSEPMALNYFKNVVDIDLVGTFNVMRLALAQMINLQPDPATQERGVVINIASIAAYEGQIGQVAYSAAKAGVVGMTLPAAREMASYGVRVVCVAPGVFDTPMLQAAPEKVRDGLLANTVFPNRFGKPQELADFIAHVITNPMLNGDTIRFDGAIRMPPR